MTQRICLALLVSVIACDPGDDDPPSSGTDPTTPASTSGSTSGSSTSDAASSTTSPGTQSSEGSTGPSTSASTSDSTGIETSTSSTAGGSTGSGTSGSQEQYGACEGDDNTCPRGTDCQRHGGPLSGTEWCAAACTDDLECPAGPGGTATPVCYAIGTNMICALECDAKLTCPEGMECNSFGGSGGDAGLCTWGSF